MNVLNYEALNGSASFDSSGSKINSEKLLACSMQVVADVAQGEDADFSGGTAALLVNQGVTYTANATGIAGNDITIELVDPGEDSTLIIDVVGKAITVTLAYATGAVTTDADALVAAINLDVDASDLVTASGTGMTPLADLAETPLATGTDGDVDVAASSFEVTAHGLSTGMKGQVTTSGTLPAPLLVSTDYFVIVLDANSFQLAASLDDAIAGEFIVLEDAGEGESSFEPEDTGTVTVAIEVSNDFPPDGQLSTFVPTNWTELDNGTVTVTQSGVFLVEKFDISYQWMRVVASEANGGLAGSVSARVKGYGF